MARLELVKSAVDEKVLVLFSEFDHILPERQDALRIFDLTVNSNTVIDCSHPRSCVIRTESPIWCLIPLHWDSGVVTSHNLHSIQCFSQCNWISLGFPGHILVMIDGTYIFVLRRRPRP